MADAIPTPPPMGAFGDTPQQLSQGLAAQVPASALQPPANQQSSSPPPQIAALLDKVQKYYQQQQANQQKTQGVDQALLADPVAQKQIATAFAPEAPMPDIKNYEVENKSSLNAFKDLVPALAIFAGSFSKQPLMNAMAAATGAMEGYNQGRRDLADQKMKEFKASLDEWKQHHEDLAKAREDIIDKDGNVNYARLAAWASAAGKPQYLSALQTNPPFAAQMFKDEVETTSKLLQVSSEITKNQAEAEKARQFKFASGKKQLEDIIADPNSTQLQVDQAKKALADISNAEKGGIELSDEDYNAKYKNDPTITNLAESYYRGVPIQQLSPGWSKNDPRRAAIQRKAEELHPNFDWASQHINYIAQQSGARGLATQNAKIDLASNMLDKSLPSLMTIANKVSVSPSTDINKAYNFIRDHASSQDFSNFRTQLRAVTGDYAQLIGRGRTTVHSDEEALRILNEDMGITSLQGFVDAVTIERNNVKSALQETQQDVSGGNTSNNNSANVPPPPPGFNVVP